MKVATELFFKDESLGSFPQKLHLHVLSTAKVFSHLSKNKIKTKSTVISDISDRS